MDWEGFAARLPEEPPAALLRWARQSCGDELGGDYTVYRCQRRADAPTLVDLFDNRSEGRKGWVTVCTCTCCGEDWITRKGETAGSFWVASGEDGTTYPADADDIDADCIEVTENDQLLCPLCGCETTAVRAKTIGAEKTKRLQIAQLANIDGYTAVIYWLVENYITQYGSHISAAPRYAYVLDGRGALRMYSHRRAGCYGMDLPGAVWKRVHGCKDKWDAIYTDWMSINGRKKGSVLWPGVPELAGTTGEKTGMAEYWAAQGDRPVEYLKLWRKCRAVENLVKAGFGRLVSEIVAYGAQYGYSVITEARKVLDLTKRKPHEMLRLTKEDCRAIGKGLNARELEGFQRLRALWPGAEAGKLMGIVRAGCDTLLADQVKAYGGTPEKYERYLEKQGQGWQGLGLLRDARHFAGALHPGQALTQEEIWPARLRQTHDRLAAIRTAAITQEESRKLQAGFDTVLRRYGGLQWTDGELEILLPKSNQELVAEGQTLRHCVGGYGAQHAAGQKIILFVRHHRRPERSYYTLNISFAGDRPEEVQLHGYGNERHGEHKEHRHRIPEKVRQFVDGWEKNILLPWYIQNMKKEKSA